MAQYKVPQDVEADDKLLGPFSFRQFVYLMIAGALIALSVGLFQLFPLLAIIPVVPALFFLVLALPLKKDQPMETYLAAILSYHMKPHTRTWKAGQRGTTIEIMAPKKVEPTRTRDITGEEATHRLSFLADIVDTEGYAIKGINTNPMREDLMAEASTAVDMFEGSRFDNLASTIQKEENAHHAEVVRQMQATIHEAQTTPGVASATPSAASAAVGVDTHIGLNGVDEGFAEAMAATGYNNGGTGKVNAAPETTAQIRKHSKEHKQSDVVVMPEKHEAEIKIGGGTEVKGHKVVEKHVENSVNKPVEKSVEKTEVAEKAKEVKKAATKTPKPSIIELANNDALSVATIAKEAKRIKRKEEGEVFISLH